jgi:glutathione S-transferase
MIELIQIPYSPYCIVQKRILEFSRVPFKILNVPNHDRSLIWKLSRGRYYGVPIIREGKTVVFETSDDSQIIAKYLSDKLNLDLFPEEWRGIQSILCRFVENEVESFTFKLNDIFWEKNISKAEHAGFVRHKERKFGRGCLEKWKENQAALLQDLESSLTPFEQMLMHHSFLLTDRPLFLDFDLYGMLGNFLYSGEYQLPEVHSRLKVWYGQMSKLKSDRSREKLRA